MARKRKKKNWSEPKVKKVGLDENQIFHACGKDPKCLICSITDPNLS